MNILLPVYVIRLNKKLTSWCLGRLKNSLKIDQAKFLTTRVPNVPKPHVFHLCCKSFIWQNLYTCELPRQTYERRHACLHTNVQVFHANLLAVNFSILHKN